MGIPKEPQAVKLFVGFLTSQPDLLEQALEALVERFGAADTRFGPVLFSHTSYYARELGPNPLRALVTFAELVRREVLPEVKLWTNALENRWTVGGLRKVNVDPGYLTPGQLFLASTKDQRQRVYMREGIYVEPTLFFRAGAFHPFEWTYPDYREANCLEFLKEGRGILLRQLRHLGTA